MSNPALNTSGAHQLTGTSWLYKALLCHSWTVEKVVNDSTENQDSLCKGGASTRKAPKKVTKTRCQRMHTITRAGIPFYMGQFLACTHTCGDQLVLMGS